MKEGGPTSRENERRDVLAAIIYSGTICPAEEAEDGETQTRIFVTKENNGYGTFRQDARAGMRLEAFEFFSRSAAIEAAVQIVLREREAHESLKKATKAALAPKQAPAHNAPAQAGGQP